MRHRKSFSSLGRKSEHRKAMMANMASSLIIHKRIKTTEAKAKALRVYVEPLITKSKTDTTHSRRVVFSYLKQKEAVSELFRVVGPKVADRPGGYTRIVKLGFRPGDGADMALIELVDFNEEALAIEQPKAKKTATRRGLSRRGSGRGAAEVKSTTEQVVEETTVEEQAVEEAPVEEKTAEEETESKEE